MKLKFIGLALLTAGLSSAASASVYNAAAAVVSLDLSHLTFSNLTGVPTESNFVFSNSSTSVHATSYTSNTTSTATGAKSSQVILPSVRGSAKTTGNVLKAVALATNGTVTSSANKTVSFTLTGIGRTLLQIPFSLVSSSTSNNITQSFGNSSGRVQGSGYTNSGKTRFSLDVNSAVSDTGGSSVQMSADQDFLAFILTNTVHSATYTLAFNALSQSTYQSSNPAPVPEIPVPLMLTLGLLPLVSRRGRKMFGLNG